MEKSQNVGTKSAFMFFFFFTVFQFMALHFTICLFGYRLLLKFENTVTK